MEAQMLLRDPDVFPSQEVLRDLLGEAAYSAFGSFMDYGLPAEWRYYNDGKQWLCKVVYKKKTVLWLSVWERFFRASFFFTEKHLEGVVALEISEALKQQFALAKPVGRLIPMMIDVSSVVQLTDLLTVVQFKIG